MDWKIFLTAFISILVAEMGDKTQLAILGFSTKSHSPISVFLGAMCAFFILTLLAVIFGDIITKFIPVKYIHYGAGALFIIIGVLMLINK